MDRETGMSDAIETRDGARKDRRPERDTTRGTTVRGPLVLTVAFLTLLAIGTDLFVVSPLLPSIALITLLSPRMGALATRIGPRLPMTVGPLIVSVGTLWLAGVDGSAPYVVEILPGSLLQGLGMAVTSPRSPRPCWAPHPTPWPASRAA